MFPLSVLLFDFRFTFFSATALSSCILGTSFVATALKRLKMLAPNQFWLFGIWVSLGFSMTRPKWRELSGRGTTEHHALDLERAQKLWFNFLDVRVAVASPENLCSISYTKFSLDWTVKKWPLADWTESILTISQPTAT